MATRLKGADEKYDVAHGVAMTGFTGAAPFRGSVGEAGNSEIQQVLSVIDTDSSTGYELRSRLHMWLTPISTVLALWAFVKTATWAAIRFIGHPEHRDEGTRWVWFNPKAGIRTWWCIPNVKSGEQLLPRTASLWFDGLFSGPRRVRHGSASWRALELIYNWKFQATAGIVSRFEDFWFSNNNCRGVRNRHRLITKELYQAALNINRKEIRILSVACGSAEAVIQVVKRLRDDVGVTAHVTLLDLDSEALAYAQRTAEKYGVANLFNTVNENIKNLEKVIQGPFDIVEMLGFLDYQLESKAVSLCSRLRTLLISGGYFLTCNILPNHERFFVRWVISWPMIYRKPHDLARVLLAAGFAPDDIRLIVEPARIHCVAVSRT